MRRAAIFVALTALTLWAQTARDAYRGAYRAWREADPALERDASTANAADGARADRVAIGAAKYGVERRTFLDRYAQESAQKMAWVDSATENVPAVTKGVSEYIVAETTAARRAIDVFANDTDPGIQQVRNMLERENLALTGLNAATMERKKTAGEVDRISAAIDDIRKQTVDLNRILVASVKKSSEDTAAEAAAWTDYYRKLSDGIRGSNAGPGPVSIGAGAPEPPRAPSITPIPIVRYTGDWVFPEKGAFHGAQPEFVDLVVREENGHCTGRMVARFVLPSGSSGDPVLRFEFSGEFKNSRVQTFDVQTSDGAKGTIDLIPGGAFNLLEINVQIAANAGKVRQANVVLIKK